MIHPKLSCRRRPASHTCPTCWSRTHRCDGARPRGRRERQHRREHAMAKVSRTSTVKIHPPICLSRRQRPETVPRLHTPCHLPNKASPLARPRTTPRHPLPTLLRLRHQAHIQHTRREGLPTMASTSTSYRERHPQRIHHPLSLRLTHGLLATSRAATTPSHRPPTPLSIWDSRKKHRACWLANLRACGIPARMVLVRHPQRGEAA